MNVYRGNPLHSCLAVISEMPIAVFQARPAPPGALRKSGFSGAQVLPPRELENIFSLEPHMRGSWGYVFRYEIRELEVFQSGCEEEGDWRGPDVWRLECVEIVLRGIFKQGYRSATLDEKLAFLNTFFFPHTYDR